SGFPAAILFLVFFNPLNPPRNPFPGTCLARPDPRYEPMARKHAVGIPLERLAHWDPESEAELRSTENGVFRQVLGEVGAALEGAGVVYALMGGIASNRLGRPRWTHDIDVFVQPGMADAALDALAQAGFDTERTDPVWLFKA